MLIGGWGARAGELLDREAKRLRTPLHQAGELALGEQPHAIASSGAARLHATSWALTPWCIPSSGAPPCSPRTSATYSPCSPVPPAWIASLCCGGSRTGSHLRDEPCSRACSASPPVTG